MRRIFFLDDRNKRRQCLGTLEKTTHGHTQHNDDNNERLGCKNRKWILFKNPQNQTDPEKRTQHCCGSKKRRYLMRERERGTQPIYFFIPKKKTTTTTTTINGRISGRRASNETKLGPIEAPANTDPNAVTMEQELGPRASIPGYGKGTPAEVETKRRRTRIWKGERQGERSRVQGPW